jgi:hypothetical protein
VAVLSDLLGIQARSGCFCAGPYIHRAYPIDDLWSQRMHAEVAKGHLGAKLALIRLSFPYHVSEAAFAYVLDAVHLIADQGWKLLPLYRFDPDTATWEHQAAGRSAPVGLRAMLDAAPPRFARAPDSVLAGQLDAARRIIDAAGAQPPASLPSQPSRSAEFERIRWFPLPSEALERLRSVNRPRAA